MDSRADIVKWAHWGIAERAHFNYAEIRPMPLTSKLPLVIDCSSFVTLCYYLAGAPDPNGMHYNHYGYTGTLLNNGEHIPLAQVQPGDVIVYGPGTGWHTALIVEAGPDPLTISMGKQGDPSLVRVSQDGRLPQTYLRFNTTKVRFFPKVIHKVINTFKKHPVIPPQEHSPVTSVTEMNKAFGN